MAGLNMSQALQNIGANLPNIFRQRQQDAIALQATQAKQKKDEEYAAQQAELSRIITELKKGELEQANVAREIGAEGRKAVDEFTTSRGIKDLPISREYGQPLSDIERAEKYSLRKYAPYEPSAKSIVEGIDARDKTKGQRAPGVYGARLDAFNANPNAVPELISSIELAYSNSRLKDYEYEYLLNRLKTDPVQASLDMDKIILGPAAGRELIYGQTPAKVDQKYALVGPTAATAGASETAKGSAEAHTPQFIAQRKKEWDATTKDYNEAYQQYTLGVKSPDNSVGDVALVNALEKVREINSAVMYGDYQKWKNATNLWGNLIENGVIDATGKQLTNRLPTETKESIKVMLNDLFANRQDMLKSARQNNIVNATSNYGWDEKKADQVYYIPELGNNRGMKPTIPKDLTPVQTTDSTTQPAITYKRVNGKLVRQ